MFQTNLLLLVKDLSIGRLSPLLPLSLEVLIVDSVWDRDTADVNLCLGSDHIPLLDASQRTTVEHKWSRDEQQTGAELLQEHHMLKEISTIFSQNTQVHARTIVNVILHLKYYSIQRGIAGGSPKLMAQRLFIYQHNRQLEYALFMNMIRINLPVH